ncbi:unnamed protein product [Paramecium sonneborni]|uniref:RING-type domain-containing protein n=1 Tax=Paramecium sonneborni TaxID=65129 RepID=A0A8S1PJH9_9CILI|nr:unnamed protein product [Paramecium sonneborni]
MGLCASKSNNLQRQQANNLNKQILAQPNNIEVNQTNPTKKEREQKIVQYQEVILKVQQEARLDDVLCKLCSKQINKDKSIKIEQCGHYFDINCFIYHFKEQRICCRGQKIKLNEKVYPKPQVDEIMKNQLKQIKFGAKKSVQCSTQYCPFIFIYQKELNKSQSMSYFCDKCSSYKSYDQEMCQFIKKQTAQKNENGSDQQSIGNQQNKVHNNCSQIEHQNAQTTLPCNHKKCKECLFQEFKQNLKAQCDCGKNYSTNIFKSQKRNELQEIYDKQLEQIMQGTNLSWQFCRQNCGFFYNNQDTNNKFSYCIKCDEIKVCYKCKYELFSEYIAIPECNHNYHLICSIEILMNNKLKDLSCCCGTILDINTKKSLNIKCLKCNEYDDNLMMLECFHFIHKKCRNLEQSECQICRVPFNQQIIDKLIQKSVRQDNYQKLN